MLTLIATAGMARDGDSQYTGKAGHEAYGVGYLVMDIADGVEPEECQRNAQQAEPQQEERETVLVFAGYELEVNVAAVRAV